VVIDRHAGWGELLSGFIETERESGIRFLQDLSAACRAAYRAACKFDGLAEDVESAIFSDENPFVMFYDKGMKDYFRSLEEYRTLGYCGMSMKDGRAQLYKRQRRRAA
jgi:hypothetical protein